MSDTRTGPAEIGVHESGLELQGRAPFRLSRRDETVHCALVLDLGNSRTAGLIIDDFDGDHALSTRRDMHMVPLVLQSYQSGETEPSGTGTALSGVVPSLLVAENQGGLTISCLRVGDTAEQMEKQARTLWKKKGRLPRFSFASPKLAFWDDSPIEELGVLKRDGDRNAAQITDTLPEEHRRRLAKESDLIGEMVLELLEQAETQINRWAESTTEQKVWPGPRRITKVALSYPTGWTVAERNRYIRTIQNKIDEEWVRKLGMRQVDVVGSIDEATAVVLAFATNSIDKNPLDFRIGIRELTGHEGDKEEMPQVAVGVIDIGGGTTDMALVQLGIPCADGAPSFHGTVEKEGGTYVAGNEFLKAVAERIAWPSCNHAVDMEASDKRQTLVGKLLENTATRQRCCRECFYGMALGAAMGDQQRLASAAADFCFKFKDDLALAEQIQKKIEKDIVEECRSAPKKELLETIAKETFENGIIRPFLKAVEGKLENGWIVMSGKPFEIPAVRHLFENAFQPLKKSGTRLLFMGDFELSGYWKDRYCGTDFDVKLMTVIGGAIAFLVDGNNGATDYPVWNKIFPVERIGQGIKWVYRQGGEVENGALRTLVRGVETVLRKNSDFAGMPDEVGYVIKRLVPGSVSIALSMDHEGTLKLSQDSERLAEVIMQVGSGERNWVEDGRIDLAKDLGIRQTKSASGQKDAGLRTSGRIFGTSTAPETSDGVSSSETGFPERSQGEEGRGGDPGTSGFPVVKGPSPEGTPGGGNAGALPPPVRRKRAAHAGIDFSKVGDFLKSPPTGKRGKTAMWDAPPEAKPAANESDT
jgi:hypothetical protein